MFCSQCGHKLPTEAKFCINCGAKVIIDNLGMHTTAAETDFGMANRILFRVHGKELVFDNTFEKYTLERKQFLKITHPFIFKEGRRIQKSVEQIIVDAQNNQSRRAELDKALLAYYEYGTKAVELLAKTVHESLIKKRVYSYSLDRVKSMVESDIGNFIHVLSEFSEKLEETMAERENIERTRAQQREGRSYWQGGGFGVANAVKGAIKADLMNLATGAVRGVGDMITDSRDDKRIFEMKYNLLTAKPWAKMLYEALSTDSHTVFQSYTSILQDEGLLNCPEIAAPRSNALFKNSTYIDNLEEKTTVLLECILNNPYNTDAYQCLLIECDLNDEIIDVIDYFLDNYSIVRLSSAYCRAIINKINDAKNLRDDLSEGMKAYKAIDRVLKLVEEKKETSEFYNFLSTVCADKLNEGLSSIEIVCRTSFDGLVHDSVESRDLYEKEYKQYQKYVGSNGSGISPEEERKLIAAAKACDFRHEILLKKIDERENALAEQVSAQTETFESYFTYLWPIKEKCVREKIPESARRKILCKRFSTKSRICPVTGRFRQGSP